MWKIQAWLYKHAPKLLDTWLYFTATEWLLLTVFVAYIIL
jgi:hypothetical protein